MRTLSERSGMSERQIQRALKSLETKGYFVRLKKQLKTAISSNVYDLSPLVKILDEVAEHFGNQHPRQIRSAPANPVGADTGAVPKTSASQPVMKRSKSQTKAAEPVTS